MCLVLIYNGYVTSAQDALFKALLGVPPLTTLACGNHGKMIKFNNSTWVTAIYSTGFSGWHTIDTNYNYATYIVEAYASNNYSICYVKVYMSFLGANCYVMDNAGSNIPLKKSGNRLAVCHVDSRQGMTIKVTCFNYSAGDVYINYGEDVSSWADVTYPTT